MKWGFEEELLLLELHFETIGVSYDFKNEKISQLSALLKRRALFLDCNIDDKFRNTTGINMKLQNILFVISEGEKGLSSVSKLDKKVYEYYNKNKDDFFKICSEIFLKYVVK